MQQRIDELTAFRQNVRSLTPQLEEMMARGNEPEIISYFDRMKLQGEYKALLWLQNRNKLRRTQPPLRVSACPCSKSLLIHRASTQL
jgi:hypothetical protein